MATARFHGRRLAAATPRSSVDRGRRFGRRRRSSRPWRLVVGRRRRPAPSGSSRRHEVGGHGSCHHRCIGRIRRRGPNAGGRAPGQAEQPEHAAALAAERFEQGEHTGVVGARLAGQVPGDDVGQVVVADGDGVVVAAAPARAPSRRSTARCRGPAPASPPARRGAGATQSHRRSAMRADLGEGAGPLGLDAERVEPPRRPAGEALGSGRQQQPEVRAGRRLAELVAQPRPTGARPRRR